MFFPFVFSEDFVYEVFLIPVHFGSLMNLIPFGYEVLSLHRYIEEAVCHGMEGCLLLGTVMVGIGCYVPLCTCWLTVYSKF